MGEMEKPGAMSGLRRSAKEESLKDCTSPKGRRVGSKRIRHGSVMERALFSSVRGLKCAELQHVHVIKVVQHTPGGIKCLF